MGMNYRPIMLGLAASALAGAALPTLHHPDTFWDDRPYRSRTRSKKTKLKRDAQAQAKQARKITRRNRRK